MMRFPLLLTGAVLILNCASSRAQMAPLAPATSTFSPEVSLAIGISAVPVLSPDGQFLAVAKGDIKVYGAKNGELLAQLPTQSAYSGLAFSPDGQTLAVGVQKNGAPPFAPRLNQGEIQVWNWRAQRLQTTLPDYSFTPFRFSDDGQAVESNLISKGVILGQASGYEGDKARIATLEGTIATRWQIATKTASRRVAPARLPAAFGANDVTALNAPDAPASLIYDNFPTVEAAQNGALPAPDARVPLDDSTTLVAFSPDGAVLYRNGNQLKVKRAVIGSDAALPPLEKAYAPNDLQIASDLLLAGQFGFQAAVYDLKTGAALWVKPLGQTSLSADGKTVVGIETLESAGEWDEGAPRLLDARSGEIIGGIDALAPLTPPEFLLSSDGQTLIVRRGRATKGRALQALSLADLSVKTTFTDFPKVDMGAAGWNAARGEVWIADGSANGGGDEMPDEPAGVRRWNARTGAPLGLVPGSKSTTSSARRAVAVSPDGRVLALSDDESLRAFDLETNQLLWKSPLAGQRNLCFAPDGKTLVVAADYAGEEPVSLWNAATGAKERDLDFLESNSPRAPSFAPNGKTLALSLRLLSWPDLKGIGVGNLATSDITPRTQWNARGDRYLRAHASGADLWDVSDKSAPQLVKKWDGTSAQFGAGDTVWSAQKGALLVQSARDGSELARLYLVGETDWLVFTPDGFYAGTPAGLKYLSLRQGEKLWRASELPARNNPQKLAAIMTGQK